MVIVRVAEVEKSQFEKYMSRGTTFDVLVDGKKALILHEGLESELDLSTGQHAIRFRETKTGNRSNKLQFNVQSSDDNITIEVREGINELTASLVYGQIQMEYSTVTCEACGAINKVMLGKSKNCEYCGSPLAVAQKVTTTNPQNNTTQPNTQPIYQQPAYQQASPSNQQTAQQMYPPIPKPKKPWYKNPWAWVGIFFVELIIFNRITVGLGIYSPNAGIFILIFVITIVGFFVIKKFIYDRR